MQEIVQTTTDGRGTEASADGNAGQAQYDGLEARACAERGEGVFATRPFGPGDTVLTGVIVRELDHNHRHASQIGEDRFVEHGGLIPKVNHSCDPNCGIRVNATGAHDLVARRPVVGGEEITFDYAMRNYTVDHFPVHCRCGSRLCRDRVTGWQALPADRKAEYQGLVAPYLLDIDNRRGGG